MESVQNKMVERQETQPQSNLEAPFVTIVRDVVHKHGKDAKGKRISLSRQQSFDIMLDEINRQTIEGLYVYDSKVYPGVSFLAGHLSVTPEIIEEIASNHRSQPVSQILKSAEEPKDKFEHYVYFVEPSFGIPPDGSALSALDMAITRFVNEMPKVAAAIRRGQKPPAVDIYIVGSPDAFGAQVTTDFVDSVRKDGFDAYGKLYAEFVKDHLFKDKETLDRTRVVIQGASKGSLTSDATAHHLPEDIKQRMQLLYDNPGGNQGRNLPTQIGRSINLGGGMAFEVGVRQFAGAVKNSAFKAQKQFYEDIARLKNIPKDSDEQKRLKGDLFFRVSQFVPFAGVPYKGGGEMRMLSHGTPLDEKQRSYTRISTPDPVNLNFRNLARVNALRGLDALAGAVKSGFGMEKTPRRGLVSKQHGRRLTFATSNIGHNFPWVKSVENGSWDRKMRFVEETRIPKIDS